MAINNPIIAAGPAQPRGRVLDQRVTTHPVPPGETYRKKEADGTVVDVTVGPPNREGQVIFHMRASGTFRNVSMYVGVPFDVGLGWVPIIVDDVLNHYGVPFDPIND